MNKDQHFKKLWLINGYVFLTLLLFSIIFIIVFSFTIFNRNDDIGLRINDTPKTEKKIVKDISSPQDIYNTDYALIELEEISSDDKRFVSGGSFSSSKYNSGITTNVLILNKNNGQLKKVLQQRAFIRRVDYPSNKNDINQNFIIYKISFEDTDGNTILNSDDESILCYSNLDGNNFRRITSNDYDIIRYNFLSQNSLFIVCSEIPEDKTTESKYWKKKVFIFDFSTKQLLEYSEINNLLNEESTNKKAL